MIALYLLPASSGSVILTNDPALDDDLGTPFTPRLVSIPFKAAGWSTFRRFVQDVEIGGQASLTMRPVTDGSESTAFDQTQAFDVGVDGPVPQMTGRFQGQGSLHQVAIEVPTHAGSVKLGSWVRYVVARRSER